MTHDDFTAVLYMYGRRRKPLWNLAQQGGGPRHDMRFYGLECMDGQSVRADFTDDGHDAYFFSPVLRRVQGPFGVPEGVGFNLHQAVRLLGRFGAYDVLFGTIDSSALPVLALKWLGLVDPPVVYQSVGLAQHLRRDRGSLRRDLHREWASLAGVILCFSQAECEAFVTELGIPSDRVRMVTPQVDLDYFTPSERDTDGPVVSVGRDPFRDFETLFRACEGVTRPVEVICSQSNLEGLSVPRSVAVSIDEPIDVVRNRYRRSSCVAVPVRENVYSAGSTVFLQGMACGRPCIISKTQALASGYASLRSGKNCIFVKPGSARQLREAIDYLAVHPAEADAIGNSARETVERHFRPEAYAEALKAAFSDAQRDALERPRSTWEARRSAVAFGKSQLPLLRRRVASGLGGWRRALGRESAKIRSRIESADISIFHELQPAPTGGGNQFIRALSSELRRRGYVVEFNALSKSTRACLFNSFNFDADLLRALHHEGCRMVHRVDGPIAAYRGWDDGTDSFIASMNGSLADVTVFQSDYSLAKHVAMGLSLRNPRVIMNAADPVLFHPVGKAQFSLQRKTRLIATSWSDNAGKGQHVYEWMDQHLDWTRYTFDFVGRTKASFENIRVHSPTDSTSLARRLRNADIFVAASENDPCSNSLIEALSCGLPSLYLDSGGHPEIVGSAGLPFDVPSDIPDLLEQFRRDYNERQAAIAAPRLAEVATLYLDALGVCAGGAAE